MNGSGSNDTTPQPIRYHAGASVLPDSWISHVAKNCANPPKMDTPRQYTIDIPVARISRGNISGNIAMFGTAVNAINTPSTATTANSTGTVGDALIIMHAGYITAF